MTRLVREHFSNTVPDRPFMLMTMVEDSRSASRDINRPIDGAVLEGVAATTLWTLRNRAVEAMRPERVIEDPLAIELYRRISYDYDKFGAPSQVHPLRALAFDDAIRTYTATHPAATVVALGEGLQTGFWRIAAPNLTWLSVDLAPVIELRDRLLPAEPQIATLSLSALDRSWMDSVDSTDGVIITAEGLLMYFDEDDALALIADCAQRFPGGQFIFDSIPVRFSAETLKGMKLTGRYTAPPMPFSLSVPKALALPRRIAGIAAARDILPPPGRGAWGNPLLRKAAQLPPLRYLRPCITLLDFARTRPGQWSLV